MPENLILKAAAFADRAHKGQTRKDGITPYVNHVARVAGRVATLPYATEEMVAAAYLHDVVEDCGIDPELLTPLFGENVVFIVEELTNLYSSKTYPELPREERKKLESARLSKVSSTSAAIKLVDRLDNIRDIDYSDTSGGHLEWIKNFTSESEQLVQVFKGVDTSLEKELSQAISIAKEKYQTALYLEGLSSETEEDLIKDDLNILTGVS